MNNHNRYVLSFISICFLASIIVLGLQFCSKFQEDTTIKEIQGLKPSVDNAEPPLMDFSKIQAANRDIIAWLVIPDTRIDYPIVQSTNNNYYLHHDAFKNSNRNGALFLDYRVRSDFSDFSNVIYGHHMESGMMFQNLIRFKEEAFFTNHTSAMLFTPNKTRQLEIFAVAVVSQNNELYQYAFASITEKETHLKTIKEKAIHYRDMNISADDRIVIFSTCSYEFSNARTIVAARLRDFDTNPILKTVENE